MSDGDGIVATCIILTFDRLELLRHAVASAQAQDHDGVEVLVVDNGSRDGTAEWLDGIDDPRLSVLRIPENTNPTHARNLGLERARGEWVGFLDDDDLWAPDKVSAMLDAATRHDARWVYCGCVYIDADNAVLAGRPAPSVEEALATLPVAYPIPGGLSGLMWHTSVEGGALRIDERMSYCDDWDVSLRLAAEGAPARVNRPLMAYRQHPAAWSRTAHQQANEYRLIAEKHAAVIDQREVRAGIHHRYIGGQAARAGARGEAIRHYLQAIKAGDLSSVPRLLVALMPRRAQAWLRRHTLSDRRWVSEAQPWVADLASAR